MKKQIIYTDHANIKKDNVQGKVQEKVLNDFITRAEEECKTTFTDEEKVELKNNAEGFLRAYLKKFYQFPNASDEFNIQALGVDLNSLTNQFKGKAKNWNKYPYQIKEGLFTLDTEAIEKRYTKYTSNEFQSDAVELANDLIKLVEKGIEKGIINTDPQTSIKIAEAFRFLALDTYSTGEKHHNLAPSPSITRLPKLENAYILQKRKKQEV
ncbi:hypothetical protein V6B16_01255 [Salinimicrobium catena]|uniref:hypothetical protein n=1 Tax=Salinimicrobium catena TaxID=390640 RepID=UPI002FE4589A